MTTLRCQADAVNSGPSSGPRSPAWVWGIQIGVIAGLLLAAYWPEVYRVVDKWQHDGNWSHGWLVPLFSLYFVYMRRRALSRIRAQTRRVQCERRRLGAG